VHARVGVRLELPRQVPAVRLGQFLGLLDHASALLGSRRDHDLGAEHPHDPAALDRERLGHADDHLVALGGADHGQGDPRVAGRGLDEGVARADLAALLGLFHHRQREAVLDGREGVEVLGLDVPGGGEASELGVVWWWWWGGSSSDRAA